MEVELVSTTASVSANVSPRIRKAQSVISLEIRAFPHPLFHLEVEMSDFFFKNKEFLYSK